MDVVSIVSRTLDIPPSAVALCPGHPDLFVVGTYFLHRDTDGGESADVTQKRSGSLMLWRLEDVDVTLIETISIDSAVLDLEWTPHAASLGDTLCVATSTGSLIFYRLDNEKGKLSRISEQQTTDEATLVLDLLWHPKRADTIAITLSDGNVSLCRSTGGAKPWAEGCAVDVLKIANHTLEPWTLAFSPDTATILSGGDDAVLQATRTDEDDSATTSTQLWSDRRIHQAGVTSILPLSATTMITGSYDDHIRLLYTPAIGRKKVLAELNLGGGVWRTKMLSEPSEGSDRSYVILASCMHAGSRVVRLSCRQGASESEAEAQWQFEVLAKFEEHQSMNYGSDVQPAVSGEGGKRTVVSTSFYDKLMCVWQIDLESM